VISIDGGALTAEDTRSVMLLYSFEVEGGAKGSQPCDRSLGEQTERTRNKSVCRTMMSITDHPFQRRTLEIRSISC
jgi:hypothetical protein